MIAACEAEIDRNAKDEIALSAEDRASREQKLLADLLLTERQEEASIVMAEERGLEIDRRADADVRAVLGLADDFPVPTM